MDQDIFENSGTEINGRVFHFPRNKTAEFQSRLECIRNENGIRTAFVVRYIFKDEKGIAVVPEEAVNCFSDEQIGRLKAV